ncbi:MAG TPA: hypothetical protein VGL99_17480 [Chloroflexota bacterium]
MSQPDSVSSDGTILAYQLGRLKDAGQLRPSPWTSEDDQIGIVAFEDQPRWVIPPTPATDLGKPLGGVMAFDVASL